MKTAFDLDSDLFDKLMPATIGFDRWTSTIANMDKILQEAFRPIGKYPPYNIIKYLDNSYRIEIGVAGFDNNELSVTVGETDKLTGTSVLTVSGKKQDQEMPADAYLYRGLAGRDFTSTFTLADNVEVTAANLLKGVLHVSLKFHTPKKIARTIPITNL